MSVVVEVVTQDAVQVDEVPRQELVLAVGAEMRDHGAGTTKTPGGAEPQGMQEVMQVRVGEQEGEVGVGVEVEVGVGVGVGATDEVRQNVPFIDLGDLVLRHHLRQRRRSTFYSLRLNVQHILNVVMSRRLQRFDVTLMLRRAPRRVQNQRLYHWFPLEEEVDICACCSRSTKKTRRKRSRKEHLKKS